MNKTRCFIDIGSNSVRALLAEINEEILVLNTFTKVTRLSQGLSASKRLSPSAVVETIAALHQIQAWAQSQGATDFHTFATWALREAEDAQDFLRTVFQETGLQAEILSPEEEARLAFLGATHNLALPEGRCLLLDLGGGTLNLSWGLAGKMEDYVSLPLGARIMKEAFFHHDPPLPAEIEALSNHVKSALEDKACLEQSRKALRIPPTEAAVGCGGAFATLAAFKLRLPYYQREQTHGFRLSAEALKTLAEELLQMPFPERRSIPSLGSERADIAPAGALIAAQTSSILGLKEIINSDDSLLLGLALDFPA